VEGQNRSSELGAGRALFDGVKNRLNLKLINSRGFSNGNVALFYQPAG